MSTESVSLGRLRVRRTTLLWGLLLVNTELLLVMAYHLFSSSRITGVTAVAVPFVWINVGLWAVARTDPPAASQRQRTLAVALATAYFGLLAYFGGLWAVGASGFEHGVSVSWFTLPPGWAPAVSVSTHWVSLSILPYKLVGYLALAYLIYATVLDAAESVITGVLGFLSCVSCSWPIIATIVTGIVGGGTAISAAVYDQSYLLSTVVFVATVALLYWRPGWN